MTNEVGTPKSFDQRMLDMFKENVGTLLSEEEMRKIIERGMENLFFTPKMKKSNQFPYDEMVDKPPLAYQIAEKLFLERAEHVMMKWLNENQERMFELMEKQLCNENLQGIMLQMFSQMFTMPIQESHMAMRNRIYNFAFQNNLNPGEL